MLPLVEPSACWTIGLLDHRLRVVRSHHIPDAYVRHSVVYRRMLLVVERPGTPRGVADVAAVDPTRPALVYDGEVVSFSELDQMANGAARLFAEAGVRPGSRAAVMLDNSPALFAVHHALARLGALVVPMPYRLTAPEVSYMLEDSAAGILVHGGFSAAATGLEEMAGATGRRIPVFDATRRLGEPCSEPPSLEYLGAPVTTMTYTSGTTGRPKGIRRPAPVAARHAPPQPFAEFWGFQPSDVHLLCGPAYHTAPGAYAHMTLVEGGSVVIMQRFDAVECLRLVERHGVTTSHMVPANFIRILQEDWQSYDLSSLRRVLHAAAPCPVVVKRRVMEVFPRGTVWEYYGASEGMVSVISPEEWIAKPGSVGRPFPGITVKILDDSGRELPAGEVGIVFASAMGGHRFEYHNAPSKTADAWRDGLFTVGDLGYVDHDGYLFLVDRRTDLIVSGGVNVYPAEVEQALAEDTDVVDAAVFGLPDEVMGQRVHAIVELRAGAPRDAETLVARLSERLAAFKLPRSVEFVDELPREPNGKVRKARLAESRSAGPQLAWSRREEAR